MKDFTLKIYSKYIAAIKESYNEIIRFDGYFERDIKPENYCIIRHDVDRKPKNALDMAKLEARMGVKAVYYFRAKPQTFKPNLIKEIAQMGHEIGYHYESLSDTDGDIEKALVDFEKNLAKFRQITTIKTISMHGRPLKPYDNRDIWKISEHHELLLNKFKILGEVYLDIDYLDIAYINDTGRNWTSQKSNRRDKVNSNINCDFDSAENLLFYLKNSPHPKMIFQIHPERWTDDTFDYYLQASKDKVINLVKSFV